MPFIVGTAAETTRNANTVMARSFFPRAKKNIYPQLCSSYASSRPVEPHAAIGSIPPLRAYKGSLGVTNIASYSLDVPNLLFKNVIGIKQQAMEFDQTRTIMQLADAVGLRLADFWDQLWAKRLLAGSTSGSQTVVFDGDGKTYTVTIDGQPLFSASHPLGKNGANQSNIISGSLPSTNVALVAQDIATTAQQMVNDAMQVIQKIKDWVDPSGMPLFPTLDTKQNLVFVVPPLLEMPAKLAFMAMNSTISQTTNIAPSYIQAKAVVSSGYLDGFPDPEDPTGVASVAPVNATDYYVFITDDYVKPFYMQMFKPTGADGLFPRGYNADRMIDAIRKAENGITVDEATTFASTRVDTTFRRIGADADAYTIQNDQFLASARLRGNIVYGPPFLSWRVKPSGGA